MHDIVGQACLGPLCSISMLRMYIRIILFNRATFLYENVKKRSFAAQKSTFWAFNRAKIIGIQVGAVTSHPSSRVDQDLFKSIFRIILNQLEHYLNHFECQNFFVKKWPDLNIFSRVFNILKKTHLFPKKAFFSRISFWAIKASFCQFNLIFCSTESWDFVLSCFGIHVLTAPIFWRG